MKADKDSPKLARLQQASRGVTQATAGVVASTKSGQSQIEETGEWVERGIFDPPPNSTVIVPQSLFYFSATLKNLHWCSNSRCNMVLEAKAFNNTEQSCRRNDKCNSLILLLG